jgi:hypothetical protein
MSILKDIYELMCPCYVTIETEDTTIEGQGFLENVSVSQDSMEISTWTCRFN